MKHKPHIQCLHPTLPLSFTLLFSPPLSFSLILPTATSCQCADYYGYQSEEIDDVESDNDDDDNDDNDHDDDDNDDDHRCKNTFLRFLLFFMKNAFLRIFFIFETFFIF